MIAEYGLRCLADALMQGHILNETARAKQLRAAADELASLRAEVERLRAALEAILNRVQLSTYGMGGDVARIARDAVTRLPSPTPVALSKGEP